MAIPNVFPGRPKSARGGGGGSRGCGGWGWNLYCIYLLGIVHGNLTHESKLRTNLKKLSITFLAPPAERQRSFSNAELSVVPSVRLSVRPSVKSGGRGQFQKHFSNFFWHRAIFWDGINHISKDRFGLIALKVISQGRER